MGKRLTVWIDGYETKTAADLTTAEECDAYRRRALRNAQSILDQLKLPSGVPRDAEKFLALRELPRDIPHSPRTALFRRKIALLQIRDRKQEILRELSETDRLNCCSNKFGTS